MLHLTVANRRYGSKAALTAPKSDFRFAPEGGHKSDITPCLGSAINGSEGLAYSITSSASASKLGGTTMPSALAVF